MLATLKKFCSLTCLAACALAATARAADLRIGYKTEVTSADPHVLNGANRNIWAHVYETLVAQDAQLRPKPGLAVSWRMVNPKTWEFKLRPNVPFHNGAVMTAEDVKYSIERAMHLNGPRTFRSYLKEVESAAITAPLTLQIKTKTVSPTLPDNLGQIAIVPRTIDATASEAGFASGKSAIGTGPYKFVGWANGQKITLARNPGYWGAKEPWDNVTFSFIPREPARAAALLSGSVDIINDVNANILNSLKAFETTAITSYMLNYIALDQFRDVSPFVRGNDGKPLTKNPLRELKVRQALMSAINREGIIRFLMKGDGTAAEQLVPKEFFGFDPSLKLAPLNLAKARELLAQAGYPSGFQMTIHCPNNRYINDAKLCEAVAQSLSQIGVATEVTTMPYSVFSGRAFGGGPNGEPEFSAFLVGYGAVTGDSLTGLISTIHTTDKSISAGVNNYGRYSNPQVDALIDKAAQTVDDKERALLQQQATRLALEDGAIIPLLHLNAAWAMKKNLSIKPRADGFTMAMDIRAR